MIYIRTNDGIYVGYKTYQGTAEEINSYIFGIDKEDFVPNEYLIFTNTDEGKTTEMRFDGEKFVNLRLPPSGYIKGKNSLQRCALDLLFSKDIPVVAILGGYGTGKTFLSMVMALYHVDEKGHQDKILGIREAKGEGASVGFLPGEFKDKVGNFFKPLEQQLNGGAYEFESLVSRGVLDVQIPYYLKGTTYNDTIIVVDEAEDLTESQIRLIGTRLGRDSRIFFSGDYKQSLICKNANNALVKMCNELKGNPLFGCIILEEDVRSEASKMFADLFQ